MTTLRFPKKQTRVFFATVVKVALVDMDVDQALSIYSQNGPSSDLVARLKQVKTRELASDASAGFSGRSLKSQVADSPKDLHSS
jgi:hypothetical protein